MTNQLKEGFSKGISNDSYHDNRTHVSSSGLKLMLYNPKAYYEQYVLGEEDKTPKPQAAFDFGSYIHSRVLEPHLIEEEYAIYEGATKRGKAWDQFKIDNPDKILLSRSQINQADAMLHQYENSGVEIGSHGKTTESPYSSFFNNGDAELTACTSILDVPVKVRFDYYKLKEEFASINDVKTTAEGNLSLDSIQSVCDKYHYDLSAALYIDVASKLTDREHDFFFLFMSKKAPYDVKLFKASKEMLQRGRDKYMQALCSINTARCSGIWYENKIEELS